MSKANAFIQEFDSDKAADKMVANFMKKSGKKLDAKAKEELKAKYKKNMEKIQARSKKQEGKREEDLNVLGKIPTRVHRMTQDKKKRESKAKKFLKKIKQR